jgi:hypothetical protein
MDAIMVGIAITVWVMAGFFTAFLMRVTDEIKGRESGGEYWIKDNDEFFPIIILLLMGPFSLFFSISVMRHLCSKE